MLFLYINPQFLHLMTRKMIFLGDNFHYLMNPMKLSVKKQRRKDCI
jgi:hypothetical protein